MPQNETYRGDHDFILINTLNTIDNYEVKVTSSQEVVKLSEELK